MEVDSDFNISRAPSANYTILRIKRKRTDEPLDALVIDSKIKRKKAKGVLEVFQFAETVEESAFEDEQRKKDLQERISALARDRITRSESQSAAASERVTLAPSPTLPRSAPAPARQYKIIPRAGDVATDVRGSPKLADQQEGRQQKPGDFRVFDAVPMAEDTPHILPADDPEMLSFLPLLQEYLKINDINPAAEINSHASASSDLSHPSLSGEPVPIQLPAPPLTSADPEYVWDVFYHRAGLADDYEEMPNANIGTLTGLPASFDDPYSSDEDSEPEDEADEDSNAEEYYKNDYPDEESGDSDYDEDSDDMSHGHLRHNGRPRDLDYDDDEW